MTNKALEVYTPENAIKWNQEGGADSTARPWIVERVADLSKHGNTTLLDIGSGTGRWTKQFAEHIDFVRGIDISPAMIKIAKRTNPRKNLEYFYGDFLESNLGGCDIVTALASIQDFRTREELNQAYDQVRNTLNSNGHFIFYAPHPHGVFSGGTSLWKTKFNPKSAYTDNFPFTSKIFIANGATREGCGYHHQLAEYTADLNKHDFQIVDMQEFFAKGDRVPHALVVHARNRRRTK